MPITIVSYIQVNHYEHNHANHHAQKHANHHGHTKQTSRSSFLLLNLYDNYINMIMVIIKCCHIFTMMVQVLTIWRDEAHFSRAILYINLAMLPYVSCLFPHTQTPPLTWYNVTVTYQYVHKHHVDLIPFPCPGNMCLQNEPHLQPTCSAPTLHAKGGAEGESINLHGTILLGQVLIVK